MLNKVTLHVRLFKKLPISGVIGMSHTLAFDRDEVTHFWFDDETFRPWASPTTGLVRSINYHMHGVEFMGAMSHIARIECDPYRDVFWETAECHMLSGDSVFTEVRSATVVDSNPDEKTVTIVWERTMTEETMTISEWEERKKLATATT